MLCSPYLVLRARRPSLDRYLQHLFDAVSLSAIYGDVKPAPDSEIFLIEARVARLFGPGTCQT